MKLKLEAVEVKTEARFGLSGPDYPWVSILEDVSGCSLSCRFCNYSKILL